jgi:hypothetical protein
MKLHAATFLLALATALAACAPRPEEPAAPETPAETPAAETPAPAAAPAITDASTTREVHDAYIIPGSNLLFAAENEAPADEPSWAAVQAAAQQVIDGAELLKTGARPEGRADWTGFADGVAVATRLTAEALAVKNADDLVFTNGDMMTSCTACHQAYRTTPADAAPPT